MVTAIWFSSYAVSLLCVVTTPSQSVGTVHVRSDTVILKVEATWILVTTRREVVVIGDEVHRDFS
jgi:hypothetical protein